MRIVHTSDWHLNDRLGPINRQPDISNRLVEIARYLDEYRVDTMIVSGDIFSQYTRLEDIRDAIGDVNRIFKPFLLRGGTIIAISGNHDNEALFNLMHHALDMAFPLDPGQAGPRPAGRLYLAAKPTYLLLQDSHGQQVQFALIPYPTSARYLRDDETNYRSIEEKNVRLHSAVIDKLHQFSERSINPNLPSVLVTHIHIRGSELHNLYRISEREDVVFDLIDLPVNWSYIACGHIHKPQAIPGTANIRYAGSIDRMDAGEKHDQKSIVFFEVDRGGLIAEPICLPLNATPIYNIEIFDPSIELSELKAFYPESENALVTCKIHYKPGEHDRDQICRDLEAIFPRCYKREFIAETTQTTFTNSPEGINLRDLRGTVQAYLAQTLAKDDAQEQSELLALAEALLLNFEEKSR